MTTQPTNKESARRPLLIRSWPKMIFLWPTALLSFFLTIANHFDPVHQNVWGGLFLFIWGINMLVLTFDFPRMSSLTAGFFIICVGLALVLANQRFEIFPPMARFISGLTIHASTQFYATYFLICCLLFGGMAVITRFDYWELSANELIHHHGPLGDMERFSTVGLKLNKEINDFFEYCLAGAGRVILLIPSAPRPIVLDNVLNINRIEKLADRILDASVVRVETVADAERKPQ